MKFRSLLAACLVLGCFSTWADEPQSPDEIMAFAVKKMSEYKTWSAHFNHLLSSRGMPLTSEGQIICKPPQLRAQITADTVKGPLKTLMAVGPDRLLWLETEGDEGGKVLRGDLKTLSADDVDDLVPQAVFLELMEPAKLWETAKKDFDFVRGTNQVFESGTVYVLEGTLKPQTARALLSPDITNEVAAVSGLCRFMVGTQDGFIHLIERSVKYTPVEKHPFTIGEGEGLVLKSVTFNKEIPDEKFVYTPPQGIPIQDLKAVPPPADPASGDPPPASRSPQK